MIAPTLLVGIGGTGSGIVQRVYDLASPEQREHIGFVVFDTDVNELREIEEKTPKIKTVQTSNRMTVGEYLEADEYSRDMWFPVNKILNSKALTEGAGQVRAISRLALNTTIKQGKMTPLDEAIEELYELNGQRTVQAPRVIVTGSLCGGTGSGLVLPISLYIRNFMSTKLQQGSAIIRGFFVLPEVFDSVIKTQSERNNLRSNAYAAIREIDAFMMKDDGSLPEGFDVHFYAPRAGSKQPEEYKGRPMDFCFLFDAQNINGQKLKSFADYKEHAAHCIYGMAVAPTSKRSNSSEDNVIREIVFAGGRNRYAGAGSSILRYPTEDVKKYLALCWTRDSISKEWLVIDRQFIDKQKERAKARKQGADEGDLDRGDEYISTVDAGVAERKSFATAIREATIQHDTKGYAEKGTNWDNYIVELENYITERIERQKEYISDVLADVSGKASKAISGGDEEGPGESESKVYSKWYEAILTYKNATFKNTESLASNIIYSMFKDSNDNTKTPDVFRLEYWLHGSSDVEAFIHPNAVRYFLYNLSNVLEEKKTEAEDAAKAIRNYCINFEKTKLKYDTDENSETSASAYGEKGFYANHHLEADNFLTKLRYHSDISEAKETLQTAFNEYTAQIDQYWDEYIRAEVYKAGIAYVKALCKSFHGFYRVLDKMVGSLDLTISKLKEKYEYRPGEALRYVCADKQCLEGLEKEVANLNSGLETPAEMNARIFNSVKMFALAENEVDEDQEENYFMNAFNDSIVDYFKEEVVSQYQSVVEMDVISAMEKEAEFRNPKEYMDTDSKHLYAKRVIEGMEMLAKPFIESPVGKEPRIIPACAFSSDLDDPQKADFPGRQQFVRANLKDHGGEEDDSISKDMILFYQAVYDIRANELSKFAPARTEETFSSPEGDYYKAYYELINQINPDTAKSKVITPHIDKWWHIIDKLPDLDEKSQEEQEKRIYSAFFWGVVGKYVTLDQEQKGQFVYHLDQNRFNRSDNDEVEQKLAFDTLQFDDHLIVSNGTPCDHVYEILDALTIYPALVMAILGQAKRKSDKDLYDKKPLKESYLYTSMREFTVQEFQLGKNTDTNRKILLSTIDSIKQGVISESEGVLLDTLLEVINDTRRNRQRSIFELPIIMKASVPAEKYYEKKVKRLLDAILETIKVYLHRFCSDKEFFESYRELLIDQYSLFLKNISNTVECFPLRDLFHDSMFIYISGSLYREFERLGLNDEAAMVNAISETLKESL